MGPHFTVLADGTEAQRLGFLAPDLESEAGTPKPPPVFPLSQMPHAPQGLDSPSQAGELTVTPAHGFAAYWGGAPSAQNVHSQPTCLLSRGAPRSRYSPTGEKGFLYLRVCLFDFVIVCFGSPH